MEVNGAQSNLDRNFHWITIIVTSLPCLQVLEQGPAWPRGSEANIRANSYSDHTGYGAGRAHTPATVEVGNNLIMLPFLGRNKSERN